LAYFTYLWKNETWTRKKAEAAEGHDRLDYAAGDRFTSAGVTPGSTVFVITVEGGELYLGGYIHVGRILDCKNAALTLGQPESSLWGAKEYIVAEPGTEVHFRGDLLVPRHISHHLQFERNGGFVHPVPPKIDAEGKIDRQTLRHVRKLYRGSESVLFALLKP